MFSVSFRTNYDVKDQTIEKLKEMGFWHCRDHKPVIIAQSQRHGTPITWQIACVARLYHTRPLIFMLGCALLLRHGLTVNPYYFWSFVRP